MRQHLATKLLFAVGASPAFVDDVIGDLEEIAAQRRDAAESCGVLWYAREVIRALPYACRDGLRGSTAGALVDVAQKALSAWLLLAIAAMVTGVVTIVGFEAWSGGADQRSWLRSDAFVVLVLLAATGYCLLLGYVAVWIDTKRPLLTLLAVVALDAVVLARIVGDDQADLARVVMTALVSSLIVLGGIWRVVRGPALRA